MTEKYSKRQVDRAGQVLREYFHAPAPKKQPAAGEALEVIEWWRAEHAAPMQRVNAGLRHYVGAEAKVTQRLKRLVTLVDKLDRFPKMQLSRMEDIGGVRVLMPSQDEILAVVKELQSQRRWNIRRERFYLDGMDDGPKADGYRAVHLVVVKNDRFVEVQFRTPGQDRWANSLEKETRLGPGEGLKWGTGPADLREYYRVISELIAMTERGETPAHDFMERLSKLYAQTQQEPK